MGIIDWLLRRVGIESLVRTPGKGFHNLTLPEVADMIDDHLGCGSGSFAPSALSEFRIVSNEGELEAVRQRLLQIEETHRTDDEPSGLWSEQGHFALERLAAELRGQP